MSCGSARSRTPGPASPIAFSSPRSRAASPTPNATQQDEIRVGSLDPIRDISDVRDVVRAYRLLALKGTPGSIYNVCSGTGVSVREVADRLLAAARRPLRITVDPDLVRPVEVPRLIGDATRLRAATGWAPAISLDETLAAMLRARAAGSAAEGYAFW